MEAKRGGLGRYLDWRSYETSLSSRQEREVRKKVEVVGDERIKSP